ncbi:MAG TPA: magnesium and cobalt transport protein CorA [Baekduia sp.]|nr:magnesium and cobalt transport protein CorA [Baekduia sp.]
MIVDCAHYREGRRQDAGAIALEEAAARCREEGFVWLGMFEPRPEELDRVRETFGLHELAVEDAQSFHLRPKVERYDGDVAFVILRTARYDAERHDVEFGEISIFVGPSFVITVRHGAANDLHDARLRLEHRPDLLRAGTAAALWAILDTVVDGYAPVLVGLEGDIEEVEQIVFAGEVAPTERIYSLRREATDFHRAVHPLLASLEGIERGAFLEVAPELEPYFRDVRDHLRLVNEEVTAQRELLTTCLEANMAVISVEQTKISVRQNDSIKQLTIIATVFLPLTVVTGFFGQNFGWLVDHIDTAWAFIVFGIGGLLLPCALLYTWFTRSDSI